MAEAPRLAAALQYQQGLDDITRPATVNPMMARQVAKSRELMTAPTSIMDERYPAWKKAQENADLFLLGADVAGLTPVAAKGAVAAAKFAAPKIAQGLEQHMVRSGMMLPIDVWHGTPHKFAPTAKNPLGEFDATKIGTGEGAQAYGYGHYLAEAKGTGATYKSMLAGKEQDLINNAIQRSLAFGNGVRDSLIIEGFPKEKITSELEKSISKIIQNTDKDGTVTNSALKEYENLKRLVPAEGSLYKVDLPDEAIARMMDYDKHLSEQSPHVQKILSEYQKEIGTSFGRGDQVLKEIAFERRMKGLDDSPAAVAKQLSEMNIPGIQYLDAGSRGTSVGKGTRNFVVFPGNEGLLNILGRE